MRNGSQSVPQTEIAENRSLRDLIQGILQDIQRIIHAEIQLARAEIGEKARRVRQVSMLFGGAAICGALSAACLVTACIAALALVLPVWLAALLMGVLFLAGAGAAFTAGRTRMQQIDLVPRQTVATVKENLEWAEHQTK